jgi:Asp-tRNA(Asn)/Glu-tRNA(Gln) amidotransferase C subunit
MSNFKISEEEVAFLSKFSNLHLSSEQFSEIKPQLTEWIEAANQLNEKMSDSKYLTLMPVTVFHHLTAGSKQGDE